MRRGCRVGNQLDDSVNPDVRGYASAAPACERGARSRLGRVSRGSPTSRHRGPHGGSPPSDGQGQAPFAAADLAAALATCRRTRRCGRGIESDAPRGEVN